MRDSLSLEKHVPKDCPPVFLVNCVDDPVVKYYNSVLLDSALTANKVPHKYIQYKTGGHGFGASTVKGTAECRQWKDEFLRWLGNLKLNN
jgi:acetyl esterase/lipase